MILLIYVNYLFYSTYSAIKYQIYVNQNLKIYLFRKLAVNSCTYTISYIATKIL